MENSYTDGALDYFSDLLATDAATIWADLDLLGNESDAEKWKAKISSIARDYLLTPRFALMRILCNRAMPYLPETDDPAQITYSVLIGQDLLTFRNISMEHARNLSVEEHINYLRHLMDLAGPSPDEDPDLHARIIARVWHSEESANVVMIHQLPQSVQQDACKYIKVVEEIRKENKKRYSTRLLREEVLQLGHILHLSWEEVQWLLTRVFHVEETNLRPNHSHDLIEIYGYRSNAGCKRVDQLKKQYDELSSGIQKIVDHDRIQNWTQNTNDELLNNIERWAYNPDTMDEKFMEWLLSKAPGLDIPSQSALRLYRNLAAYAYAGAIPEEQDFLDEILHIADMDIESEEVEEFLYLNGELSPEKCARIAEDLYYGNNVHSGSPEDDSTKPWSVITLGKDNKVSVSAGIVNTGRTKSPAPEISSNNPEASKETQTRIFSLLMGFSEIEKGDILYLLWYVCSLVWTGSNETNTNVLYDRIFDLKDAAQALLDVAGFHFYPPHLMEQSMLLSIIYGGKTGTDPSVVYGTVLQSLRETRAKRITRQEKLKIVNDYRNNPKMSLNECAEKYGTSPKNISRWQKELMDAGLIGTNDSTK